MDIRDVTPTGKWRLIDRDIIDIEVKYTFDEIKTTVETRRFFKNINRYLTEIKTGTIWLREIDIVFTEIMEFDCNEK